MSSKIDQQPQSTVIIKPEQSIGIARTAPQPNTERNKLQQPSSNSSSSSSGRHPTPLDLQKPMPTFFAALEMDKEDISILDTVLADQVTFEITQLYSAVENISTENNSLEVKQGLKALEEHIRLREYMHAKRTMAGGEE